MPWGTPGGGGDGGGGDGGGGGASSAPPDPLIRERAIAAYQEVLRRWGIPVTKNLTNLIVKAVNENWGTTLFVSRLRHTPEYREMFPGLVYSTGMTEASYNAQYQSFRTLAKSLGENLTRAMFGKMLRRGVTPELYRDRVAALQSVEKWSPLWVGFSEALAARGIEGPKNKQDLVRFAMRLGPKVWEKVWQEAAVTTALERVAGIDVGDPVKGWGPSDYQITRGDMLTIIKNVEALNPGLEVEGISGQQWADIGSKLRSLGVSYLRQYGVTTKDYLEMALGGPKAAAIAEKVDRIAKTQQAATEPRAIQRTNLEQQQQQQAYPQAL